MEIQNKVHKYVQVFDDMKKRVGSDEVAAVILEQVGKDNRCELMRDGGVRQAVVNRDPDAPATSKQIGYLKHLGVEISERLTKEQASELIDQAAGK